MNDETVHLLLVRTHQDGTATPAHAFNRGPTPVFQHWRHADRRTNDHWLRNDLEDLLRHGFHPKALEERRRMFEAELTKPQ